MSDERVVPAYLVGEHSAVVVFACGDLAHGDESIAQAACTSLPPDSLARADIKLIGPLKPELLRDLPAGVRAVVVDEVPGQPAGEIVEIPFVEMSGRDEPIIGATAPESPLDEVVAMAQLLRDEPVVGRFVGLGVDGDAADDAVGPLRDAVAGAVRELSVG